MKSSAVYVLTFFVVALLVLLTRSAFLLFPQPPSDFILLAAALLLCLFLGTLITLVWPLHHLFSVAKQIKPDIKKDLSSVAQLLTLLSANEKKLQQQHEEQQQHIDDVNALNKALLVAKQRAESLSVTKSITIANLSHEIRTAVNSIVGVVDLVQQQTLPPEVQGYVRIITNTSQHLVSETNHIVNLTDTDSSTIHMDEIPFSIHTLLRELINSVASKAQEKGLNVCIEVDPDMPAQIISDPLRLSQILMNLVANAIKFTEHGSVKISLSTQQQLSDATELMLSVKDSGQGIEQTDVEALLATTIDVNKEVVAITHQGLGLCMIKRILSASGGHLNITSSLGVGSEFRVNIPVKLVYNSEPVLPLEINITRAIAYYRAPVPIIPDAYWQRLSPAPLSLSIDDLDDDIDEIEAVIIDITSFEFFKSVLEILHSLLSKGKKIGLVVDTLPTSQMLKLSSLWPGTPLMHPFLPEQYLSFIYHLSRRNPDTQLENSTYIPVQLHGKVLLVEDNAINIAVTSELLSSLGLSFEVAENGQEALEKVSGNSSFDLILMDIQMPVMNGNLATRALRQNGIRTPIIGLSASAMPGDRQQALDSGMNGYILKPIRRGQLADELAAFLDITGNTKVNG